MNRKLEEKEKEFLQELRELISNYGVIMYAENGRLCFDVDYSGADDPKEPIVLQDDLIIGLDIDKFIEQNS